MSARIYIEGGGISKELRTRCRRGFRLLFERCGFSGRMPKLVACGARGDAFNSFKIAHDSSSAGDYIAMLIDSEDTVESLDRPWEHLKRSDNWARPNDVNDEQVLLMTTCMETWIIVDHETMRKHFGPDFQEAKLPSLINIESRQPKAVLNALSSATQACSKTYTKGKQSFEIVGKLSPNALDEHLPSFRRCVRTLKRRLLAS